MNSLNFHNHKAFQIGEDFDNECWSSDTHYPLDFIALLESARESLWDNV